MGHVKCERCFICTTTLCIRTRTLCVAEYSISALALYVLGLFQFYFFCNKSLKITSAHGSKCFRWALIRIIHIWLGGEKHFLFLKMYTSALTAVGLASKIPLRMRFMVIWCLWITWKSSIRFHSNFDHTHCRRIANPKLGTQPDLANADQQSLIAQ